MHSSKYPLSLTTSSNPFGIGSFPTTLSSFGSCPAVTQSSANRFSPLYSCNPFAPQASSPIPFGSRHKRSRVTAYTTTAEVDGSSGTATSARLLSLSSMTVYRDKNHEELRWEDYLTVDKDGFGICGSTTRSNFFSPSSTLVHSSKNPLSPTTSSNPFGFGSFPKTSNSFGSCPALAQSSANCFFPLDSSNPFAPQASSPIPFGSRHRGSRVTAYTTAVEVDGSSGTTTSARLVSLSSMTVYKDKSHEELRWEDYQTGDKGGIGVGGSTIQSNFFSPSSTLVHLSKNPLSLITSSNPFGISSFPTTLNPFGSCPALTQSSANRSSPLYSSNPFAPPASSPISFGSRHWGSRLTAYTTTTEVDGSSGTATSARLLSLSSMTVYRDKSHEELRWDDYQTGDKGGIGTGGSTTQSNIFSPSSTLDHLSKIPFSPATSSNPFGPATTNLNLFYPTPISPPLVLQNLSNPFAHKTTDLGFKTSVASCFPGPFSRTSSSANLSMTTSSTPSCLLIVSSSLFGPNNSPTCLSSTSASGATLGFNPGLSTSGSTQLSPILQPSFGPTIAPSICQPSVIAPSTQFGLGGNSSTYQTTATQTVQTSGAFATINFPPVLTGLNGFVAAKDVIGQSTVIQLSTSHSTVEVQLPPVVVTFGVLPAMSQLLISPSGSMPSNRCGISSRPVSYKPASPVRFSSLLTCQHVSKTK
ncbi:hypothetical protein NMG60_11021030 [Bertholletia excelsa]